MKTFEPILVRRWGNVVIVGVAAFWLDPYPAWIAGKRLMGPALRDGAVSAAFRPVKDLEYRRESNNGKT